MRSRKFLAEMNMYFKYFNDNAREKVLNGAPEDVNNLTFQRTASLSHQEIKTCKELRKLIYSVEQNTKITTTWMSKYLSIIVENFFLAYGICRRNHLFAHCCCLGSVVRFVVVLKPQSPRLDPVLANNVYRPMLANNLGSWCEDKHTRTNICTQFCMGRWWVPILMDRNTT